MFENQSILPALRDMRDVEIFLESEFAIGVLLEIHISRLDAVFRLLETHGKQVFVHLDLIQGLKADEFATEYICQSYKPYGIISTKGNVILKAKQKQVKTVQRLFLIDSSSLEKSYRLINRTQPDYIEVLPGLVPKYIRLVKEQTGIPVFAGGLITSLDEVEQALAAGATVVTTSDQTLWRTAGLK
ncbi:MULTISPECIES: glycerol-3-phosphate responsive antiterminator [unclassified Exiguobacterium]|uniref:glycerol-3-phosphate responsive antiterminator n=1 Tax=unclassified Exiguobacterium TaxID=2644629 RepID=UPI001040D4D7|nr:MULTISPECIES: glycerol-3-phosphate responsive antiterminator [unclassified Exiguobacterium]TCI39782.1 glycerol-3-phosphate responsive antiterminator [Exiguobacterium sp. SH4S7]TCI47525.1 glycerol-3-phosphate responsive antiterminator [Exiguobacterium sp. SH5S32]TCI54408.1 glycerol-3-phosphate responsive antiterminator [Exiguobacterium sp. SH1S4]TCI65086.1 glycerol-3-phosphate responsive antiterminator [Exiguobacterium sp. SH0S2]TCI74202.1 glycerol-3-phosphate responsive antiterminator [Exig